MTEEGMVVVLFEDGLDSISLQSKAFPGRCNTPPNLEFATARLPFISQIPRRSDSSLRHSPSMPRCAVRRRPTGGLQFGLAGLGMRSNTHST